MEHVEREKMKEVNHISVLLICMDNHTKGTVKLVDAILEHIKEGAPNADKLYLMEMDEVSTLIEGLGHDLPGNSVEILQLHEDQSARLGLTLGRYAKNVFWGDPTISIYTGCKTRYILSPQLVKYITQERLFFQECINDTINILPWAYRGEMHIEYMMPLPQLLISKWIKTLMRDC